MFIKTINYKDFDGNERSEDFHFNLTQSEILKLETSLNGGLTSYMSLMVQKQSQPDIMALFEKIIDAAYGIKSLDGRTFTKTPEALAEFKSTAAYDKFFMEICMDEAKASEFLLGIMPDDMNDKIKKAAESGVYDDATLSDAQRKAISAAMAEVAGSVAATDDTVKESVAATDDAVKEEN